MPYKTDKVSLQPLDKEVYALLRQLADKNSRTMKATAELLIRQAAEHAGLV